MHQLLNSLTADQWLLVIGILTQIPHFVFDKLKLSKYIPAIRTSANYAITLSTTVLIPLFALLATNTTVSDVIHQYFPALAAFFVGYQGIYLLVVRYWRKNAALIKQLEEYTGAVAQTFEEPLPPLDQTEPAAPANY